MYKADLIAINHILVSNKMMDKFISHTSYETQDQELETLGFAEVNKYNIKINLVVIKLKQL